MTAREAEGPDHRGPGYSCCILGEEHLVPWGQDPFRRVHHAWVRLVHLASLAAEDHAFLLVERQILLSQERRTEHLEAGSRLVLSLALLCRVLGRLGQHSSRSDLVALVGWGFRTGPQAVVHDPRGLALAQPWDLILLFQRCCLS